MLEHDYEFSCPYCGEDLTMKIDFTAGKWQSFVYDCEVCCKPIKITLEVDGDEVMHFSAEDDS